MPNTSISNDQETINAALMILEKRITYGDVLSNPQDTKNYLTCKLVNREREIFAVLFLDNRHKVIECNEIFKGTINGASVHPREVVKKALKANAAAVIFSHNHPSGNSSPSSTDKTITKRLKDALALIDIEVLDHIIIGQGETTSFAEMGLL